MIFNCLFRDFYRSPRQKRAGAAILALSFLVTGAISASAGDICKALVLCDVGAVESPEAVLHRGEYDGAITQYRVPKNGGAPI